MTIKIRVIKIFKKIRKLDKRTKIIINKLNIGAGLSRNKALKLAKGKYVAFIDADDLWMPNKLKKNSIYGKKQN